jgi:hypothetical protein
LNKKMLFLGLLLSLSQGAFAADGKIGAPAQQKQTIESQVAKPVSFVEAVQNGQPTGLPQGLPEVKEKYADKVLKEDISFLGFVGRVIVKSLIFTGLSAINQNAAFTGTALADEALIAAGLFKDSKVIRAHKDATWWQWFKAGDGVPSGLPVDYSDHVSGLRKGLVTGFYLTGVATQVSEGKGAGVWIACYVNYIIAELVRQKMITPEESPRMANVVAILLAGSMNEVIKKVA